VSEVPLVTRRTALQLGATAVLGLLAGCRPSRAPAGATASASVTPAPSTATPATDATSADAATSAVAGPVVQRVAAAEQTLLAAYDAAALNQPELASRLAPLRADHAAHLDGLLPGADTSSPSPAPVENPPASPTALASAPAAAASSAPAAAAASEEAAASAAAADQRFVLTSLADLELAAAAARLDDLADATGSIARLIASIGGCEAAHATLLSASP
jgi:hypothetical protein